MTEIIASIAGPYLFLTGLGFMISKNFYQNMIAGQSSTDPVTLNLSGAAHFIVGMTVLTNHFLWSTAAEIVVSLVGIAATVKGTGLIVLPDQMTQSPKIGRKGLYLTSASFATVGLYLVSVGFFRGNFYQLPSKLLPRIPVFWLFNDRP